jgi:hypothetical protein
MHKSVIRKLIIIGLTTGRQNDGNKYISQIYITGLRHYVALTIVLEVDIGEMNNTF